MTKSSVKTSKNFNSVQKKLDGKKFSVSSEMFKSVLDSILKSDTQKQMLFQCFGGRR